MTEGGRGEIKTDSESVVEDKSGFNLFHFCKREM